MTKKREIKIIFKGDTAQIDHDLVYSQSFGLLTPQKKLEESWKMVQHVWKLKGRSADELRFNRTVAIIKRNRG